MVSIIAIIAKNRAIGFNNKLLYNIPEDLKHFQAITTGQAVIMGENTFHSMNDKPLPKRLNIVLTKKENFKPPGCLVANSIDEAIELAKSSVLDATGIPVASKTLLALRHNEIFFIGGGQIYQQALPLADKLYLTIVDDEPKQADTFFPEYSEFKNIVSQEKHHYSGYDLIFTELTR